MGSSAEFPYLRALTEWPNEGIETMTWLHVSCPEHPALTEWPNEGIETKGRTIISLRASTRSPNGRMKALKLSVGSCSLTTTLPRSTNGRMKALKPFQDHKFRFDTPTALTEWPNEGIETLTLKLSCFAISFALTEWPNEGIETSTHGVATPRLDFGRSPNGRMKALKLFSRVSSGKPLDQRAHRMAQ